MGLLEKRANLRFLVVGLVNHDRILDGRDQFLLSAKSFRRGPGLRLR